MHAVTMHNHRCLLELGLIEMAAPASTKATAN